MNKLSDITRTEVFFTSYLHHAFIASPLLFERLLLKSIGVNNKTSIIDSSYELCLFRDAAKSGYINTRENKSFEKVTFDNVFVLSDNSIIIVEAKAQQGFNSKQIKNLEHAKKKIKNSALPWNKAYLIGLCSSKYSPKEDTAKKFDAIITWADVADCFDNERMIFSRADSIYNN